MLFLLHVIWYQLLDARDEELYKLRVNYEIYCLESIGVELFWLWLWRVQYFDRIS